MPQSTTDGGGITYSGCVIGKPSVRSCEAKSLYLVEGFNGTCHKYSSCEWTLVKAFQS